MEGAFNHVTLRLAPGASERAVIDGARRAARALGRPRRARARRAALAPDPRPGDRPVEGDRHRDPVDLPRRRGVPAQRGAGRQVATQREQIAALKALGYAQRRADRAHYLLQVGVIVALGIALGIGAGIWFGEAVTGLYAEFFHFPAYRFRTAAVGRRRSPRRSPLGAAVAGALGAVRRAVRARAGRGDAAAVRRASTGRRCSSGSASGRLLDAGDADDGAQHGAPAGARAADHARHRLGDGDHHLAACSGATRSTT